MTTFQRFADNVSCLFLAALIFGTPTCLFVCAIIEDHAVAAQELDQAAADSPNAGSRNAGLTADQRSQIAAGLSRHWQKQIIQGVEFSYPPLDWGDLRVGDVGHAASGMVYFGQPSRSFRYAEFEFLDRLPDGDAVLRMTRTTRRSTQWGVSTRSTILVGSKTDFVAVAGDVPEAKSGNEGQSIRFAHALLAIGQVRHPVYGTMPRVRVIEFPPLPKHPAQVDGASDVADRLPDDHKHANSARVREWTDRSGTFQTLAALIESSGGVVTLVRADDGRRIEVPLLRLSAEDRRHVRLWMRDQREPAE